jgi:hypothetical protein
MPWLDVEDGMLHRYLCTRRDDVCSVFIEWSASAGLSILQAMSLMELQIQLSDTESEYGVMCELLSFAVRFIIKDGYGYLEIQIVNIYVHKQNPLS